MPHQPVTSRRYTYQNLLLSLVSIISFVTWSIQFTFTVLLLDQTSKVSVYCLPNLHIFLVWYPRNAKLQTPKFWNVFLISNPIFAMNKFFLLSIAYRYTLALIEVLYVLCLSLIHIYYLFSSIHLFIGTLIIADTHYFLYSSILRPFVTLQYIHT